MTVITAWRSLSEKASQKGINSIPACNLHVSIQGYLRKSHQEQQFITWPELTKELVTKHLPPSITMAQGHMHRERKYLQSTKNTTISWHFNWCRYYAGSFPSFTNPQHQKQWSCLCHYQARQIHHRLPRSSGKIPLQVRTRQQVCPGRVQLRCQLHTSRTSLEQNSSCPNRSMDHPSQQICKGRGGTRYLDPSQWEVQNSPLKFLQA